MRDVDEPALTTQLSQPAFRMKLGREVSINKKALYALGCPEHILFWWNKSQRVLLIGVSPKETPLSFKISANYYNSKTMFKIRKHQFIKNLLKVAKWHRNAIYAVIGEYISELNMVAFRLDNAEILEFGSKIGADGDE